MLDEEINWGWLTAIGTGGAAGFTWIYNLWKKIKNEHKDAARERKALEQIGHEHLFNQFKEIANNYSQQLTKLQTDYISKCEECSRLREIVAQQGREIVAYKKGNP